MQTPMQTCAVRSSVTVAVCGRPSPLWTALFGGHGMLLHYFSICMSGRRVLFLQIFDCGVVFIGVHRSPVYLPLIKMRTLMMVAILGSTLVSSPAEGPKQTAAARGRMKVWPETLLSIHPFHDRVAM